MDKSKEKEEYLSLRGAEVAVGGNGKRGDRKLDLTSAVGRRFPPHSATKRLAVSYTHLTLPTNREV